MNGTQLYGLKRLMATLRMGRHEALKGLGLRRKLALNYVGRESKMTELDGRIYTNTFTPYYPSPAYDRFLNGLRAVAAGRPTPLVTNFAVTARCPCRCWHCSFADRSKKDELSLADLQAAIRSVQALGSAVIGLTGGEPLLRDDLEDIIASIGPDSMPLMFTTGFRLTPDRVRNLKKAGLGIPVVSLDHYDSEIHDRGRGVPGMFDQALAAIRMFQDEGFYVAVSFVPDRRLVSNRDEIFKVLDFFRDLGVNDLRLTSPILSGHLTDRPDQKLSPENVRTIEDIQRFLVRTPGYPGVFAYDFFENDRFYGCCAGFNYLFVDAEGNLCPCDFTMLSFGNLKEKPVADIWEETSRHFCRPATGGCYANKCTKHMADMKPDKWPLRPDDARKLVALCPPNNPNELPEFFRRMK
jgi:MoaA/NifB/PqqE/SkfB family radical SAM enzyme